jgi:hypothetical protein
MAQSSRLRPDQATRDARWYLFSRAASEPEPFPVLRLRYQRSAYRLDNVAAGSAVRGERDGYVSTLLSARLRDICQEERR